VDTTASTSAPLKIFDIPRVHGAERPDRTAFVLGDRTVTYGEFYERCQRVANGLAGLGVGPQDRVAFLDKNGLEHFELYHGAGLLNAVSVDVNWRLAAPEVEFIVNDMQAKVLVVGADFAPILDAIAPNLTTVSTIFVVGEHGAYQSWADWVAEQPLGDPGVESADDDIVYQLYSSGTTGRPKGVMLTNNNFAATMPLLQTWNIGDDVVSLVAMPLFHIAGSAWAGVGLTLGGVNVILRELDLNELVRLMSEEGVTHAVLVPAVLQFLQMVPGIDQVDFGGVRMIAYGASPISEEVLVGAIKMFPNADFWQVYGLTETTAGVVFLPPEDHDVDGPNKHRLRSCGLPGPGVELRIVDTDTLTDVPTGEVGEVWIRSPQVMKGYWNMPEETAKAITSDGWFRSGDAGYLDADGYLYIHDRVKDMIVSGGENIYPAEVENVLMSHPAVADAAVIGVPDEKWGETPKAIIVKVPGAEVTEAELIEHCRSQLARFKCPTSVEWMDMLPRNPSGKILKKDLREPYWEGHDRRVS
jgi:long-chain acyl-CoA synthetase